ncbi:MAG: hypothetical protein COV76_01985 [Candidatus Omnitrophica bacterium CG11_big_fil_rev_8_21_14_0_20_64_10]|nr:MAG: hypothetical protein COV76_01985 [Candidatus Omnitrophica bacterium CG11_big_fil_rev_8_21_14_0_20_64_10]
MTDKSFRLEVLTPQGPVLSAETTAVTAPGGLGYLGILRNHAPMVSTLGPGRIVYRDPAGGMHQLINEAGGLLEVRDNEVTILADRVGSSDPGRRD